MYDSSLYDIENESGAGLRHGAMLYRLASPAHCDRTCILSGEGASRSMRPGRFNEPQQRASYCANNALVCMAEVLFHMYRTLLDRTRMRHPLEEIRRAAVANRVLAVLRVAAISGLIHVDSEEIRADFDGRITGTTVVFPDPDYLPLRDLNRRLREREKRGALYPSARHSHDTCIVLFRDETQNVLPDPYLIIPIELRLVPEHQELRGTLIPYNPYKDKTHPTMGYYQFLDEQALACAKESKLIHPASIPASGMIDFVRRRYSAYPDDAICCQALQDAGRLRSWYLWIEIQYPMNK